MGLIVDYFSGEYQAYFAPVQKSRPDLPPSIWLMASPLNGGRWALPAPVRSFVRVSNSMFDPAPFFNRKVWRAS